MAEDRAVRRRLNKLRDGRVTALRDQARRQAAEDILAEQGSVSVDEITTRVDATFVEPTDDALRNLLAQKTRAGVDYEARELDKLRDARGRATDKVGKVEGLLEDARGAVDRLDEQIADAETRLREAEALRTMADPEGDAAAAPSSPPVNATANVATADADANGSGGANAAAGDDSNGG